MFCIEIKVGPVFKEEYPNSKVPRGAKLELYLESMTVTSAQPSRPCLKNCQNGTF